MTTVLKQIFNKAPAYLPRGGTSVSSFGFTANSGSMERQLQSMTAVGTLFAIVDSLAEAIGSVKWGLYRGENEVLDHPAATLWAKPNAFMENTDFVEAVQQHYELAGEMIWNLSYSTRDVNRSIPLELWPIRPDRIRPVPNPDTFIEGWIYRPGMAQEIAFTTREIIQVKRPNPLDPYRGISPVASLLQDVYGEQAAAEYNNAFFRNSAEPGGLIKVDRRLEDDEFDELLDRWNRIHQGPSGWHRVGVLEKAEFIERRYTMREMQFEALRRLNRDFIRQAFRYPKPMLGDTEDVNKANAQAAGWYFKDWLLRPRVEKLRWALNNKLLPLFGTSSQGLEFRYGEDGDNEIAEDDRELEITTRDSDANRVKTLIQAGFEPSDVLEYVGLPPMRYVGAPTAATNNGGEGPTPQPQNRIGRPRIEDDPGAREVWESAKKLREGEIRLSLAQISARLGISERQLKRYKAAFEDELA